jgi:hypothetical protein
VVASEKNINKDKIRRNLDYIEFKRKAFSPGKNLNIIFQCLTPGLILFYFSKNIATLSFIKVIGADYGITAHPLVCFVAVLSSFIPLVFHGIKLFRTYGDFKRVYKLKLVKAAVEQYEKSWTYHLKGHSIDAFLDSGLYSGIDNYNSEDCIEGSSSGMSFKLSEVHAQRRVKRGKNHRYVTIFKGFFITMPLKTFSKGETFVLPDLAEKNLGIFVGKLIQSLNIRRPNVVNFENPEFEKEFVVYSSNSYDAHYLLSPLMMENLVALKRRHGNLAISLKKGTAYIAVNFHKDNFEPNVFVKNSFDNIIQIHETLKIFEAIIKNFEGHNPIRRASS